VNLFLRMNQKSKIENFKKKIFSKKNILDFKMF